MIIIRQSIYIFSQSSEGKWVNWKHAAPRIVWWITKRMCLILTMIITHPRGLCLKWMEIGVVIRLSFMYARNRYLLASAMSQLLACFQDIRRLSYQHVSNDNYKAPIYKFWFNRWLWNDTYTSHSCTWGIWDQSLCYTKWKIIIPNVEYCIYWSLHFLCR